MRREYNEMSRIVASLFRSVWFSVAGSRADCADSRPGPDAGITL